jgi:hypothetical protein
MPSRPGALESSGRSRSSPSAAPSAGSKPFSTFIFSTTAGNRSPPPALSIFASVCASVSSRFSAALASCKAGWRAFSPRARRPHSVRPRRRHARPAGRRFRRHPAARRFSAGSASDLMRLSISASSSVSRFCWATSRSERSRVSRMRRSSCVRRAPASARSPVRRASSASERASASSACSNRRFNSASRSPVDASSAVSSVSSSLSRAIAAAFSSFICSSRAMSAASCVWRFCSSVRRASWRRASSSSWLSAMVRRCRAAAVAGLGLAQFRQLVLDDALRLGGLHLKLRPLADDGGRGGRAPTVPRPPAPWQASTADAAASLPPRGYRVTAP